MLVDAPPCCPLTTEPLSPADADRHAAAFKVLGEPVRLRIISLLAAEGCPPTTVGELAEALELSQPTVSHHLKRLTEAGFLARRPEGRRVVHTVRPELFADLRTVLSVG
ncbi:ArsR/SmtB family transcription factor [Corynebacterium timonense]|uniref:Transcriptional regulator, ArsR family n=1 Tax=Corynebacterium timonense TaxID=441500 RepID=A0A1H1UK14_9CORY|nr:metalloregulator ArsR/SmtB family transcription factor [Corynebacterium timonense]SDS72828.1 transcriptional regulator, ArsR family [Corynebacterium timonense]